MKRAAATPEELLIQRLRLAATEIDSARRYGLQIPISIGVNGYELLQGLSLSLDTIDDFDEWAEYASDVTVREYDLDGNHWHSGTGSLGYDGLQVTFATSTPLTAEPPC